MAVPVSVLLELGKFAFDQYQIFRAQGKNEMTDAEWAEYEIGIQTRRKAAWDRFEAAKPPE
ncbi:hypothetical protein LCGC14_2576520 [marine sediment metagenome]|uniref:Uncharacterized protein n=1 Tax=marine sediment metagenome TaxID=412755 RepID=A0A0F9CRW6_9ZZZZ